jgi:signal transduction histidine kinase/ActR/RegA family two-component response regulator
MDETFATGMQQLVGVIQRLSLARSLEAVQEIVAHAARSLTGADGATIVLRDGDQCFYADEDAIAPLWRGRRFPMSACISGWAMLNRQSTTIADIYADERIPAYAYRPTFVKSLAMVPIRTIDPIGAIGNYWAQHHEPTAVEVSLLQALADSTAIAIENVQAYDALAERVRERAEALDAANMALSALNTELAERQRAEAALRRTEQQLWQSQKMDAIGQLAGGIAHDFNNLLSVILTFGTTAMGDLRPGDPVRQDVEEIVGAGERAAALTRQLLMFSRHQVQDAQTIDLNQVIAGMENMLKRLIGEDISLEVRLTHPIDQVFADPGQIEQVLMNLALNARDAMPKGGLLTVETANVALDGDYTDAHLGVVSGEYVLLAVSDTGTGIDAETRTHIFEPFFTTKEKGKGTGLGLSTVYGIVKRSNGHVWVYSEPDEGTVFKVYLPKHTSDAPDTAKPLPDVTRLTGSETVLLVEDDDHVRAAALGILRRNGYNVLEARNAGEAILICEQYRQAIHLLLSDVVMPQMSGVQLARRLASVRSGMKVLCMSGYTEEAALRYGVLASEMAFLEKPFTPESLLRKIRQVLEGA